MARVIAITNQKGGVGKTTTAVNLGASLAASEQRTLIIDCDPQGNTTSALGFPKDPSRRTLYQSIILDEPIERVTLDARVEGLDLIPSDKNLVGASIEMVSMDDREYKLKSAIAPILAKYNYVLLDCPPSLDLLTINALAASDSVLVPIQCEYFALEGVSELLDTLMRLRRTINPFSPSKVFSSRCMTTVRLSPNRSPPIYAVSSARKSLKPSSPGMYAWQRRQAMGCP